MRERRGAHSFYFHRVLRLPTSYFSTTVDLLCRLHLSAQREQALLLLRLIKTKCYVYIAYRRWEALVIKNGERKDGDEDDDEACKINSEERERGSDYEDVKPFFL